MQDKICCVVALFFFLELPLDLQGLHEGSPYSVFLEAYAVAFLRAMQQEGNRRAATVLLLAAAVRLALVDSPHLLHFPLTVGGLSLMHHPFPQESVHSLLFSFPGLLQELL
jgi:hypothetical protein